MEPKALEYPIYTSDLDRRLTIQQNTASQDANSGFLGDTWSALATVWAHKMESAGKEDILGMRETSVQFVTWVIKYRSDIDAEMRCVDEDGKIYYVNSFQEVGRKWLLKIKCLHPERE